MFPKIRSRSWAELLEDISQKYALVLLFLLATLPFLQPYHDLPIPSFYNEWLAVALGIFAGFSLLSFSFWKSLSVPKIVIHFLAFIGIIAVQHLVTKTTYPAQALLPALYLAWTIVLVTFITWLRQQRGLEEVVRVLAWGLLVGGAVQAMIGLLQYLQLNGWVQSFSYKVRAVDGNLSQANNFATHIMLASLALIYLVGEQRLWSVLAGLLGLLFTCILALSGSRAVIPFIIATFLFSVLGYWKVRRGPHSRYVFMTGLALVLFIGWQLILPIFDSRADAVTTLERVRTMVGIDVRLSEWHKGLLIFFGSPFLGVGIGNYGWHSFLMQSTPEFSAVKKDLLFAHSHNLFVQILAEFGMAGFVILILLIATWIKEYFRDWLKPSYWLIGTSLLVLFIHSNLEYPLWYSFFLGITAILLGLADQRSVRLTFTPRFGQVALGSTLCISAMILAITLAGYTQLAHTSRMIVDLGPAGAAHIVRGVAGNQLLRPWAEAIAATHGVPEKNKIAEQLTITTRVMEFNPDPIKVRRQIQYLALAGRLDEAKTLLHKAAFAYASYIPSYICVWILLPDEELHPIIEAADKLWNKPLECLPNGDPIGHPTLRLFM